MHMQKYEEHQIETKRYRFQSCITCPVKFRLNYFRSLFPFVGFLSGNPNLSYLCQGWWEWIYIDKWQRYGHPGICKMLEAKSWSPVWGVQRDLIWEPLLLRGSKSLGKSLGILLYLQVVNASSSFSASSFEYFPLQVK